MIHLGARLPPQPPEFEAFIAENAQQVPTSSTRARRRVADVKAKIRKIIDAGKLPAATDFDPIWSAYKHAFAEAQHGGKCAYCETRIRAGYPGDVEHYRPKSEVKEPRNRGNRDDTLGRPRGRRWHAGSKPGYWWLAYSWTNYLFSCNRCNSWKGNSFPLRGPRRATSPGAEAFEDPLLLNPFFTDPVVDLTFNELGEVRGLTEEGKLTIDRCALDRRTLEIERERVARQLLRDLDDYLDALGAGNEMAQRHVLRRLLDACRNSAPYAGMARVLVGEKTGLRYEDLLAAEQLGLLK